MKKYKDVFGRIIRLSDERYRHLVSSHQEMSHQLRKIKETLLSPSKVVQSNSDLNVLLYYKRFSQTVVGNKFLCIVVKSMENDYFILTAYFTDTIKQGLVIWDVTKK